MNSTGYNWAALGKEIEGRLSYGDSVRKIADEIGINHVTLHRARRGRPMSMDNVLKVCRWLGCDITDFVIEETEARAAA